MKNKIQIKFKTISCLSFILLVFLSGCAFKTHVKGLEPNARPLENKEYEVLETSKAQSSSFSLLWVIPVTIPVDYNTAIDEAINDKGGDNLIDVRCWHEKYYWIVGTVDILHIEGKVIRYIE